MSKKSTPRDIVILVGACVAILGPMLLIMQPWNSVHYHPADFVALADAAKIDIEAKGQSSLESIHVSVRNDTEENWQVILPAGTYFNANDDYSQDMVAVERVEFPLGSRQSTEFEVRVLCANLAKDTPAISTYFSAERLAPNSDLNRVASALANPEFASEPYLVRQAAVWIVTDDANLDALLDRIRIYASGAPHATQPMHVARAWRVLERVGVNLETRHIWSDRERLPLTQVDDRH